MKRLSKADKLVVKNMIGQIIKDAAEALVSLSNNEIEKLDLALANVTADAEFALSKIGK